MGFTHLKLLISQAWDADKWQEDWGMSFAEPVKANYVSIFGQHIG